MSFFHLRLALIGLGAAALAPTGALSQSATACVDSSYTAFVSEMDRLEATTRDRKGTDFITAHGWLRATQACLDHAIYPDAKQQVVADFRGSIDRLIEQFARAIRTDATPPIYAMGVGVGTIRMIPSEAPKASAPMRSGLFMLSLDDAKRLQVALQRLGHYRGAIDGALGENSFRAIRLYQRSIGKPTTGVLSSQELRDLL